MGWGNDANIIRQHCLRLLGLQLVLNLKSTLFKIFGILSHNKSNFETLNTHQSKQCKIMSFHLIICIRVVSNTKRSAK